MPEFQFFSDTNRRLFQWMLEDSGIACARGGDGTSVVVDQADDSVIEYARSLGGELKEAR